MVPNGSPFWCERENIPRSYRKKQRDATHTLSAEVFVLDEIEDLDTCDIH